MIVNWSDNARLHWFESAEYIKNCFGSAALDNFARLTADVVRQISVMPLSGSIEPLLSHRGDCFRSIIFGKHSKIIFVIQEDTISIVDYWDTRQEPSKLTERL